METTNTRIHIDLCPYDAVVSQREITIKDCMGSILGKLDNREHVTEFKGSEKHNTIKLPCGKYAYLTFNGKDITFTLYAHHPHNAILRFGTLIRWISYNFDRIESIGWETMMDYQKAVMK